MRMLRPAWPPGAVRSSTTVLQPLRGAVDRRGQPRRPGPDHDQVVDRLLQRPAQAERLRQLAVRGVAQEQLVGPRRPPACPASVTPNCLSSCLTCGSASRSSQVNGTRFLARKSRTRKVSVRVARADHAQAREARRLAQKLPPGDERLQDEVAQVRVVVEELPQGIGRHLVDLAVAAGDGR